MYANDYALYYPARNRESGTQRQTLGVPSPSGLHMHEVVAKQDVPQATQHKSGHPSSVALAQEKKPRKQGVNSMSSRQSRVSQLR